MKKDENYHKQAVAVFNKHAQNYLDTYQNVSTYNDSYKAFLPFIPLQTEKILELGCGTGMISRFLLSHDIKHQYLLTDLSPAMIQIAAQEVPQAKTSLLDARFPSILNQLFDGIVAGFVLPYIEPQEAIRWFSELALCLAPRGALYLSYLQADPNESGYKLSSNKEDGCFQFYYQYEWLHHELTQAGFDIHTAADTSPNPNENPSHFYIIATRKQ